MKPDPTSHIINTSSNLWMHMGMIHTFKNKASAASSVSAAETRCPTLRSWTAPVSPPCTHDSDSAEYAGLAMCTAWKMEEYRRTFSMENFAVGRPQLRYKDVCKRDMRALGIDPESWENNAADRSSWRCLLHKQLKEGEEMITNEAIEKRTRRKEKTTTDSAASAHICFSCGKDCHSRIGLISHMRHCLEGSTMN